MNLEAFFRAVWTQDAETLASFFAHDAYVNWHCTNEHFTAGEFIRANCAYPGLWDGELERIVTAGDLTVAAARVFAQDQSCSFHSVSFIRVREGKITSIDEYWGDDGPAPQWRLDKQLGIPIRAERTLNHG